MQKHSVDQRGSCNEPRCELVSGLNVPLSRPPTYRNLAVTGRHVLGTGCQHTGARLNLEEAWHSMADTHVPDTCVPGIQ